MDPSTIILGITNAVTFILVVLLFFRLERVGWVAADARAEAEDSKEKQRGTKRDLALLMRHLGVTIEYPPCDCGPKVVPRDETPRKYRTGGFVDPDKEEAADKARERAGLM